MTERIIFTLQAIQIDFFTAFGLLTILYFVLSIFTKNEFIKNVDEESSRFIIFLGIVYLIIWSVGLCVELKHLDAEDKFNLLNRMFGKYWFGFWIQPLLWVLITQLLRFEKIRKNTLVRLLFSVLLIFSIEKMIIIQTSFQRDYLPSTWTMYNDLDIYPSNLIVELIMKITIFLLFVRIFTLITRKLNNSNLKITSTK
ncbi:hypothetical protein NJT12_07075 [Flavobacterium sp. AC]|uniref:Uncharacterized protein n=1 Tax=Flavobacterium azizsancarii TaxID=2961580 RepID=A0ABT4WAW2_9FLAO|nr:hypothetical protein [Flavobacterium azizsancarii]MDA6069377.1 hypothetical protein [Flavobacterium azizsancarii]